MNVAQVFTCIEYSVTRLLQAVRESNNAEENNAAWQAWVLYMLHAVADTSQTTLRIVRSIREQMSTMNVAIRDSDLRRMYSQDLINILFRHSYTRIEFLENERGVARNTATKYLEQLVEAKLLTKLREGRNSYYINHIASIEVGRISSRKRTMKITEILSLKNYENNRDTIFALPLPVVNGPNTMTHADIYQLDSALLKLVSDTATGVANL